MDPLYSAFFGSFARWLATIVVGFFVAHHIITVDQTAYFTEGLAHKLLVALPLLLPLALSLWGKYKGRVRFLTALEAPAGTTEASVNARIDNGLGASVTTSALLLACVLGSAGLQACGPKQYHTAVVANTSIAQAIFAVQDAETAAHNAGLIDSDHHAKYKQQILLLLNAGDELTLALKDWNPSQPVPANVGLAIDHLQLLLADLRVNSPQLDKVIFAVQTVLSVLRGSGVLPAPTDVAEARLALAFEVERDVDLGNFEHFAVDQQARRLLIADLRHLRTFRTVPFAVEVLRSATSARKFGPIFHSLILLPEVARG